MTPSWWRLRITTAPTLIDAAASWIIQRTGQGVEQPDDRTLLTTLADEPAARRLGQQLCDRFTASVEYQSVEPVDWSTRWRDGIVARRFGRLVVTPSWLPVPADPADAVIVIDPESAFGSGEHGSTRAALTLLERHTHGGERMLDFGSGSGILAIAAARLGAARAIGIEVDEESMPVAEANAVRNGTELRVSFVHGSADVIGPLVGPAEIICSNILRNVNTRLAPLIHTLLVAEGVAIFSGMEEAESPMFRPVLDGAGFSVCDETCDAGWWSVAARRA